MGLNIGSTPASGLYVGSAPAQGMYVGSQLVYPPQMTGYTDFSYGQTGKTSIATASGGQWISTKDVVEVVADTGGVITTSSTTTDRTYNPVAQWAQTMNKYEIEVSATLAENLTGEETCLFIGKPMTTELYFGLAMSSSQVRVVRYTGWMTRKSWIDISADVAPVAGDKVTLRRARAYGVSAPILAEVLVNGVSKHRWWYADMPEPGPADQNVGGVCLAFRRASWTNYYAAKLDAFDIETF